jgi:hypothetical protein
MDLATRNEDGNQGRLLALFASAGSCVSRKHWHEAAFIFAECRDSLERDFAIEEDALILHGETPFGKRQGASELMRAEHRCIRYVLGMLDAALDVCDANGFMRYSRDLDAILRQHGNKKESLRYLMAQQAWAD